MIRNEVKKHLSDGSISVGPVTPIGVPPDFETFTSSGETFLIQNSNLNKMRLRQQIANEHVESSRSVIATVDATTIVGQVFRASQDNINGIDFTCRAAQALTVDDFESYANDAALQAVWVASGADDAVLETTIVYEGSQSMYIDGDSDVGDEWVMTMASTDLEGATGSLHIYSRKAYKDVKLRFFIGDGTNTKSAPLVIQNKEEWEEIAIPESILTEDGGGTTNAAAITKVGFRLEKKKKDGDLYIDLLTAAPDPGALDIKLWDMGDTLPEAGVTSIDDGDQYTKLGDAGIHGVQLSEIRLNLIGGFRQYHVDRFAAGPALEIPTNELLTPGNYYAITFNYVDADIEIYGPDVSLGHYYNSGFAFTAASEAAAIAATGANEDLQFIIYSTQDAYITKVIQAMDAVPGSGSSSLINIEDRNMNIIGIISSGIGGIQVVNEALPKAYYFPKGGKFEQNYNDDGEDAVSRIALNLQYFYQRPLIYG